MLNWSLGTILVEMSCDGCRDFRLFIEHRAQGLEQAGARAINAPLIPPDPLEGASSLGFEKGQEGA